MDINDRDSIPEILSPSEVALFFKVNPKTVTRWAKSGKIVAFRTLGGHRRYRKADVMKALDQSEYS